MRVFVVAPLVSVGDPRLLEGGEVDLSEENGAVRVLLADEHALFREAMRVGLASEADLLVVGEAHDGIQAVGEAERLGPDVALLHDTLPNCDGIRATAEIVRRLPACKVIVVSDQEDDETLIDALEAGAAGYLSKGSPLGEVIAATRAVHRGEALVPPRMLGRVLRRLIAGRRDRDDVLRQIGRLTRREREVLSLLADGADNDDIARMLVISPETARTHIHNLMTKLGVHTRLEAAALVVRNDLGDELEAVR